MERRENWSSLMKFIWLNVKNQGTYLSDQSTIKWSTRKQITFINDGNSNAQLTSGASRLTAFNSTSDVDVDISPKYVTAIPEQLLDFL